MVVHPRQISLFAVEHGRCSANDQSASARPAYPSVGEINGLALPVDPIDARDNVAPFETPEHGIPEFTDHLRLWPLWLRGQELGAENGRNNEVMTVFSHELTCVRLMLAGHILLQFAAVAETM